MENNKNNSGKNAQQGEYKPLLGGERVVSGFGKKIPKDCESLEYFNRIGSAMRDWTKCGDTEKRGYILIALGENGDGNPDSRSMVVSYEGSDENLVSAVMNVLDNEPDIRRIVGKAIVNMSAIAEEQSNN